MIGSKINFSVAASNVDVVAVMPIKSSDDMLLLLPTDELLSVIVIFERPYINIIEYFFVTFFPRQYLVYDSYVLLCTIM